MNDTRQRESRRDEGDSSFLKKMVFAGVLDRDRENGDDKVGITDSE